MYLDDRYQLGVDEFLGQGANVHVKTNMMAILLVAAEKGFWQADEATLQLLGQQWVDLLLQHGLPGSGHTRPDHPVFEWIMPRLREDQRQPLQEMLAKAQVAAVTPSSGPTTMSELQTEQSSAKASEIEPTPGSNTRVTLAWLSLLVLASLLITIGFMRGRYGYGSRNAQVETVA